MSRPLVPSLAAAASAVALLAAATAGAQVNMSVVGRLQMTPTSTWNDVVFVHDGLAFVLQPDTGVHLKVIDVNDPTRPTIIGSEFVGNDRPSDTHGVYYSNGLAYVGATAPGGFYIFDLADPTDPAFISYTPVDAGVHNLRLSGKYLYVLNDGFGTPDFWIYDVSNPAVPVLVNSVDVGYCHDISVMEGIAYASMWDSGLYLYDVRDPTIVPLPVLSIHPTPDSTHSAWPTADLRTVLTCHENYDIGVNLWDVTQTPAPLLANYQSHVSSPTNTIVHDVMVVGDFAYVTYYGDGLRVLDISNPRAPVEVASLLTGTCAGFCAGIAQWVEDGLVYYVDMSNGLWILRLELPHDAPITVMAAKSGADVALSWNHTGESQYTVRRFATKQVVAGPAYRDVDGSLSFRDVGAVPSAGSSISYYKLNGPHR